MPAASAAAPRAVVECLVGGSCLGPAPPPVRLGAPLAAGLLSAAAVELAGLAGARSVAAATVALCQARLGAGWLAPPLVLGVRGGLACEKVTTPRPFGSGFGSHVFP